MGWGLGPDFPDSTGGARQWPEASGDSVLSTERSHWRVLSRPVCRDTSGHMSLLLRAWVAGGGHGGGSRTPKTGDCLITADLVTAQRKSVGLVVALGLGESPSWRGHLPMATSSASEPPRLAQCHHGGDSPCLGQPRATHPRVLGFGAATCREGQDVEKAARWGTIPHPEAFLCSILPFLFLYT